MIYQEIYKTCNPSFKLKILGVLWLQQLLWS